MLMFIIHCIIRFQGTLPLAKLCAMVTMKRKGEANLQTFSLPLSPHTTALKSREDTEKVSIKYIKHFFQFFICIVKLLMPLNFSKIWFPFFSTICHKYHQQMISNVMVNQV